jgi:3-mercaptopyruvate sulfurtransferase SseA
VPNLISRDDLHERIVGPEPVTVIEALGPAYYNDAHLPGAINLPSGAVERLAPRLLPDRSAAIVVYSSGTSTTAELVAGRLEALGYADVAVYAGGKEDWVEHGLPLERADPADA